MILQSRTVKYNLLTHQVFLTTGSNSCKFCLSHICLQALVALISFMSQSGSAITYSFWILLS